MEGKNREVKKVNNGARKEGKEVCKVAKQFFVGDIIETKKQHPCGNKRWEITRVGADMKMKCLGCGRIVMLDRETFVKRVKRVIEQKEEAHD